MTATYDTGRKQHVHVRQERYLELLHDLKDAGAESARLDDVAEFFGVSPFTAKRQLDGLAQQGKVEVLNDSWFEREYALKDS